MYVCQLPKPQQETIRKRAIAMLKGLGYEVNLTDLMHDIMNEQVNNLPYEITEGIKQ